MAKIEELDKKIEDQVDEMMTREDVMNSAKTVKILAGHFLDLSYNLGNRKKRALGRVLYAVLFNGLEEFELHGKEEKNLFDIAQQILYHKDILINAAIQLKEKEEESNEQSE